MNTETTKIKPKSKFSNFRLFQTSLLYQTREFFNNSTLHGVRYIAESGRPFGERYDGEIADVLSYNLNVHFRQIYVVLFYRYRYCSCINNHCIALGEVSNKSDYHWYIIVHLFSLHFFKLNVKQNVSRFGYWFS